MSEHGTPVRILFLPDPLPQPPALTIPDSSMITQMVGPKAGKLLKMVEKPAWMIGFTAVSVISGIVIYFVSQSTRKGKTDEQLIEVGEAEREIAEDMPRA